MPAMRASFILLVHVLGAGLDELPATEMLNARHRLLHERFLRHKSPLTIWPTAHRIARSRRGPLCSASPLHVRAGLVWSGSVL
jgi:hypothetical protein